MTFTGLTWDHPRGRDALQEAARQVNAGRARPLIAWHVQSLEGFESAPIADLAARHDLIVMDHPHVGEAVAEDCLTPLEALFPADRIAAWARQSVGPSLASYVWAGRTWALPLDVAAQVMARRPGRIGARPGCWDEVAALAARHPVALSLAGPHAILTLFSICGGLGHAPGGADLLPDGPAEAAMEIMARLWAVRPRGSEKLNPIGVLEAMARDEIALAPLVFGYVTYAAPGPRRIAFCVPPGSAAPPASGGVLGGTGIAFSRRADPSPELLSHVAWLMSAAAQGALFPAFGGQPSARTAWTDRAVNARWGDFYADTLGSVEKALLRPRFDGYVAFQTAASDRIRQALAAREASAATLAALRTLWRDASAGARGPCEAAPGTKPHQTPGRIR